MKVFEGFPVRPRNTPIPNAFFAKVLPFIDDESELRVTLYLFWRLAWKKGNPRFVTFSELANDFDMASSLNKGTGPAGKELSNGLNKSVARGTFLHLALESPESTEHLYLLNTDANRRSIERVQRGEIDLGAMPIIEPLPETVEQHDIFSLYESNIGILSPLIADELKEAEESYSREWIVEAFKEAQRLNKRSWRYVLRILENWTSQGKSNGQLGRRPREIPGRTQKQDAERTRTQREHQARRPGDIVRRSWP